MSKRRGDDGDSRENAYRVPAVERAFAILRFLAREGSRPLADIIEGTELNKSTAYYILQTLVGLEMVQFDEQRRVYQLGSGLVELGSVASGQFTDVGVARRYLLELLGTIDATIVLYRRLNPFEIMLIDKFERLRRIRITLQLGEHVPIQGGSFGRVFLAHDPPPMVDDVLARGLQAFTPKSVTDEARFRQDLEQVRQRGWAVDHEGFALGVSTVAAPIFGPDGRVRMVAAAVAFTSALDEGTTEQWGMILSETCENITRAIAADAFQASPATVSRAAIGNAADPATGSAHP